jgi:hypothetical protein
MKNVISDRFVIFSPEEKNAISLIKDCDIKPIGCGMSGKNTVTVSSNLEQDLNIFLQRNIKTITGSIIGVEEIRLKNPDGLSPYNLMAGAIGALICDIDASFADKLVF